jgi:hypothetical protein
MAVYFPQVAGITTSLPYTRALTFNTRATDNEAAGKRFASARATNPIRQFGVFADKIDAAGRDELEAFFDSMKGRYGEFQFLDPGGNLIQRSEDFSDASWTKTNVTVGAAQADPNGGMNAYRLTGTAADSLIRAVFLPDGGALTVTAGDALWFTASVWLKAVSTPQTLLIGFRDASSVVFSVAVTLTTGWQRFKLAWQADTDDALSVQFGGSSTWGAVAIDFYGPQVAPLPDRGGYHPTPAGYGLYPKCRFDSDSFPDQGIEPGVSRIELPVVTYS